MGDTGRHLAVSTGASGRSRVVLALLAATAMTLVATPPAQANTGYQLKAPPSSVSLGGSSVPHGIAVDQANHRIYVAIATTNGPGKGPGQIARFESDLTPAGIFGGGGSDYFSGVAVDPNTQGFYGAGAILHTPFGSIGSTPRMIPFSSAGVAGTSFPLSDTGTLPQIAVDSSGDIYYPNALTHTVQVFDSAGAVQDEITCGSCTGGAFGRPASVALSSSGDLYVVDLSPDRIVKLTPSGGSYTFSSLLQSGGGAAAVAVDPSTGDILVGALPNGARYHLIAYNSSGTQFDDFGAGLFTDPEAQFGGAAVAAQIGIDGTSHRVYVGDAAKFYVFEKTTISTPSATIKPATKVGQLTATLNAEVNANGHAALSCAFEYTDHADFEANGFTNAVEKSCSKLPDGTGSTAVEAKVSGLSLSTLYHYRVSTTTNGGSVSSGSQTFETLPNTPATATTEAPTAVTQTGATLKGKVNPQGGTVSSCRFEYGSSTSYGTNLACPTTPEAVTTDVALSKVISGLTAGTSYHYQLVVVTNAGTAKGGDVEFKTASPPSQPPSTPPATGGETPATPPPLTTPPPVTKPVPPLRCKKGFRKKKVRGKMKCVRKPRRKHRRR